MVLGIRSPWASARVTEDLHHDMGDTRLHRGPIRMAIEPGMLELSIHNPGARSQGAAVTFSLAERCSYLSLDVHSSADACQ